MFVSHQLFVSKTGKVCLKITHLYTSITKPLLHPDDCHVEAEDVDIVLLYSTVPPTYLNFQH